MEKKDLNKILNEIDNSNIEKSISRSGNRTRFTKIVSWTVLVTLIASVVFSLTSCSVQKNNCPAYSNYSN